MNKHLEYYINYSFRKGFYINSESLYKIYDIIKQRRDGSEEELNFTVERKDGYMFTTKEVTDIENEYNSGNETIIRIGIGVVTDDVEVKVVFDSETQQTRVIISGIPKDTASLMFSDIKYHLNNEVFKFIYLDMQSIEKYVLMLIFIPFIYILRKSQNHGDIENILKSQNISDKLNFLILENGSKNNLSDRVGYMGIGSVFLSISVGLGRWRNLVNYIYPTNIFYIGNQKKLYDSKKSTVKYILVTLIFGGICTGILVNWLSSKYLPK